MSDSVFARADQADAIEAARLLAKLANSTMAEENLSVFLDRILTEHRTIQQNIMRGLIWPVIEGFARMEEMGGFDLRNEDTVMTARIAVDAVEDARHQRRLNPGFIHV